MESNGLTVFFLINGISNALAHKGTETSNNVYLYGIGLFNINKQDCTHVDY